MVVEIEPKAVAMMVLAKQAQKPSHQFATMINGLYIKRDDRSINQVLTEWCDTLMKAGESYPQATKRARRLMEQRIASFGKGNRTQVWLFASNYLVKR